jgi:hypothetical protein
VFGKRRYPRYAPGRRSQRHRPEVLEVERSGARSCDLAVSRRETDRLELGDRRDDGMTSQRQAIDQIVDPVAVLGRVDGKLQQHQLLRAVLRAVGIRQPAWRPSVTLVLQRS